MEYNNMNDEQLRDIARRRVTARKELKSHATAYILVNIGLVIIYFLTSRGEFPWFIYPLFGWGIGLGIHCIRTKNIMNNKDMDDLDSEIAKLKNM